MEQQQASASVSVSEQQQQQSGQKMDQSVAAAPATVTEKSCCQQQVDTLEADAGMDEEPKQQSNSTEMTPQTHPSSSKMHRKQRVHDEQVTIQDQNDYLMAIIIENQLSRIRELEKRLDRMRRESSSLKSQLRKEAAAQAVAAQTAAAVAAANANMAVAAMPQAMQQPQAVHEVVVPMQKVAAMGSPALHDVTTKVPVPRTPQIQAPTQLVCDEFCTPMLSDISRNQSTSSPAEESASSILSAKKNGMNAVLATPKLLATAEATKASTAATLNNNAAAKNKIMAASSPVSVHNVPTMLRGANAKKSSSLSAVTSALSKSGAGAAASPVIPGGTTRYWTKEEHQRYLIARAKYGEKDFVAISKFVGTRTPRQVRTHGEKFQKKLIREQARRMVADGSHAHVSVAAAAAAGFVKPAQVLVQAVSQQLQLQHQHQNQHVIAAAPNSTVAHPPVTTVVGAAVPMGVASVEQPHAHMMHRVPSLPQMPIHHDDDLDLSDMDEAVVPDEKEFSLGHMHAFEKVENLKEMTFKELISMPLSSGALYGDMDDADFGYDDDDAMQVPVMMEWQELESFEDGVV
eukprot:CAMPEP_0184694334 /NCGR_PEP_ID=MMETSP0313-20130426/2341_1 /TAXON_ID=2792 /ORGANISM="Porphyridium aerugineum, Strain SAG 1380-2" /LENGTH=573 /DNA_ID=CAMNT_0027152621 /DNA_START=348 /DNA_END=2069 /DNA_ORIENTATION=+